MEMFVLSLCLLIGAGSYGEGATDGCKDVLQGYLTGQQSSPLSFYQIDALDRKLTSAIDRMRTNVMSSIKKSEERIAKKLGSVKDIYDEGNVITYVRWGRKTCPNHAEVVYEGWVGGSYYTHSGAAVDPLCLPHNPQWDIYVDGNDGSNAFVYGAEYEFNTLKDGRKKHHDHDIPCVLCKHKGKSAVTVIPAKKTCHKGWTKEYTGYLMAGYYGQAAATQYTCIDAVPEQVFGGHTNHNGYLFYKVEAMCGSLLCPPYKAGRELTCVVCSI